MYKLKLSNQAIKDTALIERFGLKNKIADLLRVIRINPFQNPPPYEKLRKEYAGFYSRRISKQHRLIYRVLEDENTVRIFRMWGHYE